MTDRYDAATGRDLWLAPVMLGIATFAGCVLFVALTSIGG